MTHFQPTIKALKDFNPKSKKTRKAKNEVIRALYSEERNEKPRKSSTRYKTKTRSGTKRSKSDAVGFAKFLYRSGKQGAQATSEGIRRFKESRAERRLQKARTAKAITESNLSPERKERELAKLATPLAQTKAKSTFFRAQRVKQDVGQTVSRLRTVKPANISHIEKANEPTTKESAEKPKPFGGFKSAETEHTSEGV